MWLRLAGRSGRPRISRRWSASYSGAGYPKTLFSSHVRCLKSSAAPVGGGAHGEIADLVCASREARAASPAATGCGWRSGHGVLVLVRDGVCVREGVARWRGCQRNRVWMGAPGGDLPAVAGELAGDRDRDDPVVLASGVLELAPARVQSSLRAPGDVDHLGWWSRWRSSSASRHRGGDGSARRPRSATCERASSRPW